MPKQIQTLCLNDAKALLAAGEAKAGELGRPVNIAVVDAGGHLIAHLRMDGAWFGTTDLAINKAFSARAFDMSTEALGNFAQPGQEAYGIQYSNSGRVMIFSGGFPVERNGVVIGAIGVAGGVGDEDRMIAEAALNAFFGETYQQAKGA
ncbi:GlcG/HbpS family heme-binding protein [Roseobacter weihaiensis]|uniref:GlcG/HbpS family heme-binding protein n=1 Tax=Roseobacter weihaiensis TaxID=2763262 RepID=UPI001D0B279C|nr:heme-binding protein [Roseobacter sp. H9]